MRLASVQPAPIGLCGVGWQAEVPEDRVTIPRTVTVPAGPYDWRPPGGWLKNGGPVDPPSPGRVAEALLGVLTFQVSRSEFAARVAAGACEDTGVDLSRGDLPMVQVNLADAQGYARRLSDATGETRRLQTEEEWQRAAAERFVVTRP